LRGTRRAHRNADGGGIGEKAARPLCFVYEVVRQLFSNFYVFSLIIISNDAA
jgi:hypothetical protein